MCHMRRRIHVSYEEEDTCVKADTEPVEGISRRQHVVHEF